MPIISKVGARSWKVRQIYGLIFAVLIGGSVTMLYPFTLMLAGSVKSDTDFYYVSPYPEYWFDDLVLFQKYCESKYVMSRRWFEETWSVELRNWRTIEIPEPVDERVLKDYLDWRDQFDMPVTWYQLGHGRQWRLPHKNNRLFRQVLYDHFDGDITAYARATGLGARSWSEVNTPAQTGGRQYEVMRGIEEVWHQFKAARPRPDRIIPNIDGRFRRAVLTPAYTNDIAAYNRAHGTDHDSYDQVFLRRRLPETAVERREWEEYVRGEVPLRYLRLDPVVSSRYRLHLAARYRSISELNAAYGTDFPSFDDVPFPHVAPDGSRPKVDWQAFIEDTGPAGCPAEAIELFGPRQAFERFVADRRGVAVDEIAPLAMPLAQADYHDAMADTWALRWEFTVRNYRRVFEFLLLHGRGIANTAIYCLLAVGTSLLVNPLAAYALSRYKPPSAYKIILFCMATMAFPGEVAMIPSFLLLKRFPLWPLIGGALVLAAVLWGLSKLRPQWSESWRISTALGAGLIAGCWMIPTAMESHNVSLLNTFWALILPGMANGFFIFLLKGFFDSLPRELYETAEIDGAGEWTMFWTITMSLSKPILAVIALGAFTAAYSAFMMALIIIPDQKMWTMMVWIYQLQAHSHPSVVFASIVIAAIPTFLVFVLCQNIIIRGIVVPQEK